MTKVGISSNFITLYNFQYDYSIRCELLSSCPYALFNKDICGTRGIASLLLTLALYGGELSDTRPIRYIPWEVARDIHWVVG
jgi:hypothetical protein